MKIKIITIHCIHNFGSVFQAISLQKFLIDCGYDVQIIDYRPNYLNAGRNRIKTFLGRLINFNSFNKRKNKFEKCINQHMTLTNKQYKECNELLMLGKATDVFIAGGDQLWNDFHFSGSDPAYKLTFVSEGQKVAYGTSMGRDNYTVDEIASLLSIVRDFRFIGLREKSSVNFLKAGEFTNVHNVVDPVLLMDKSFFMNVAIYPKVEKYALLYLVDKSPLLDVAVNYISNKTGLKIVHVCGFRKKCNCDYFLKDSGPEEILGLLINAEFVISASYHATLFSILFNKDFVALLPDENTNARIIELLDMVGLKQRIISNESSLLVISESINFDESNTIIENFIKISKELLLGVLKDIT